MDRHVFAHYMQDDRPELWYFTLTGREKYIHFDSLDEGRAWMKRNYKNIKADNGTWQMLHYYAVFQCNGVDQYANQTAI